MRAPRRVRNAAHPASTRACGLIVGGARQQRGWGVNVRSGRAHLPTTARGTSGCPGRAAAGRDDERSASGVWRFARARRQRQESRRTAGFSPFLLRADLGHRAEEWRDARAGSVQRFCPRRRTSTPKSPKWDATLTAPPADVNMPGGLFSSSRHWLTLQAKNTYIILRLNDEDYKKVLDTVTTRMGLSDRQTRPAVHSSDPCFSCGTTSTARLRHTSSSRA